MLGKDKNIAFGIIDMFIDEQEEAVFRKVMAAGSEVAGFGAGQTQSVPSHLFVAGFLEKSLDLTLIIEINLFSRNHINRNLAQREGNIAAGRTVPAVSDNYCCRIAA